MRDVFQCCKIKNKWQSWLYAKIYLSQDMPQKIGQTQQEKPKRQLLSIFYNRHCVSAEPGSCGTFNTRYWRRQRRDKRGLWTPRQQRFKEKLWSFWCLRCFRLWRPGVSLTRWWQLGARNNAVSWPQWIPWRFTVQKHWVFFFSSFILFPLLKGYPQHK